MSTLFGKAKRRRTEGDNVRAKSNHRESDGLRVAASAASVASTDDLGEQSSSLLTTFADLGLCPPLLRTCRNLGFKRPTPVQRSIIPSILRPPLRHILALSATGSGKTAAFVLPILHTLHLDPYGIYAVVLTPTRELAKQIQEQVLALGSCLRIKSALVVGGMDQVQQSCELSRRPHFVVATPGRLAELLRGPEPPALRNVRYVVLDEADRLLSSRSGFERDVAEVLLHSTTVKDHSGGEKRVRRRTCQTLLFSATMTRSLESLEEMAGAGVGRLPLQKFVIRDDGETGKQKKEPVKKEIDGESLDGDTSSPDDSGVDDLSDRSPKSGDEDVADESIPKIPVGLRQEYIFMPSRVRDAYLVTAVRNLIANGGRRGGGGNARNSSGWNDAKGANESSDDEEDVTKKARSAIIFVSTCERAARVSGILSELGVDNVALHSLLSQNRRLAALGKFKSQHVRVLVATDVASRGLDVPSVDLVLNAELPRRAVDYVHRVGRTARAGRRGRAVSLVCETDVSLVHAAEKMSGRTMEKCPEVTDEKAVRLLGSVTKATRLTNMKLMDIGFDELVKKQKERKKRDRRERQRAERAAKKLMKRMAAKHTAGDGETNGKRARTSANA